MTAGTGSSWRRCWPAACAASRWRTWSVSASSGRYRCYVSAATLIPRPDTECLVEQALARLPAAACRILDLGTGTGAIALALASERPDCAVTAVDVMPDAVALAQRNVERLGLTNVTVLQSSWLRRAGAGQTFRHLIVSNPPYIDAADPPTSAQGDVRFEPLSALVAAEDGLADLTTYIIDNVGAALFAAAGLAAAGTWLAAGRGGARAVYP